MWKGDRGEEPDRANYKFDLRPDGRLEFAFKGPVNEWYNLVAHEPVMPKRWSRVTAVYKDGQTRLSVNDEYVAEGRMEIYAPNGVTLQTHNDMRMIPNSATLEVGRGQQADGSPGYPFYGAIDELRIWNVALATPQFDDHVPAAGSSSSFEEDRPTPSRRDCGRWQKGRVGGLGRPPDSLQVVELI